MAPPPPITPTVTPQALLNQSASAAVGIPADVMKNMSKVILLRVSETQSIVSFFTDNTFFTDNIEYG